MARTVMASRNPSSSPSSLAWLCSTFAITRSDSCFMKAGSRVSVPFKLVRIEPRERDDDGENGNHFPAHACSQSVRPILPRPLSKNQQATKGDDGTMGASYWGAKKAATALATVAAVRIHARTFS